jgi:hypothetical protein
MSSTNHLDSEKAVLLLHNSIFIQVYEKNKSESAKGFSHDSSCVYKLAVPYPRNTSNKM